MIMKIFKNTYNNIMVPKFKIKKLNSKLNKIIFNVYHTHIFHKA